MATGPLSPVMLIASSGLLDNQGLAVAANLVTSIDAYSSVTVVEQFGNVIDAATAAGNTIISDATLQDLRNLGAGSDWAAITDSFPTAEGNTPAGQFTGQILARANTIMGNGDLTIFAQIYNMCRGYQSTSNQFIGSANGTGSAAATFVDMDAVTTGGISLVATDTLAWGQDLEQLGILIDPADIANLGFPSALLRQVLNAGGLLPSLQTTLTLNGITPDVLTVLSESTVPLDGRVERNIYAAMQTVTGDALVQVLQLLEVTRTDIATMADLLDPLVIFPNSAESLILLVGKNKVSIYLPDGAVNSELSTVFGQDAALLALSKIIPADQALANRALSRSFFQIKNLLTLALPDIARSSLAVQSNTGLGDINALTQPVPAADAAAVKSALAPANAATGPGGKFTLYDFIGTAAGYPYIDALGNVVVAFANVAVDGGFNGLLQAGNGAYPVMLDTLAGTYGNAATGPITGVPAPFDSGDPYANADVAFATYITVTQGIISNIANNYAVDYDISEQDWTRMVQQYNREPANWQLAMLEIDELLANNRPAIMSIITDLHTIGTDITPQGPSDFFQAVANLETQAGQAVIASLREGRNIENLQNSGIGIDTNLPTA